MDRTSQSEALHSHLLARRRVAQRIGNLVGRLKFSDDQLQQTQRGLKDAGVAMPNFGNVRLELAKEINEEPDEPEEEIETEDERMSRPTFFSILEG
jgi:Ras GTPase-activating-like protein IQGAP2/3